ncbi:MAG: 23S rRNA (adenine(2503)-C(2))-methyltransferase RlmN [Oscillospiraceae bacterium]
MDKQFITSFLPAELEEQIISLGQPKFRAKQIFDWLHVKKVNSFEDMTNLPKSLISLLNEKYCFTKLTIEKKLVSKIDGTIKYLYKLNDQNYVESVCMEYKYGISLCLSTQVGCKMGCRFCASTKAGFVRNLDASEILQQVYSTAADIGKRISSIVLMGIGEPLDNYDNVIKFLMLVSEPLGNNLSLRHVSLSTCGLVDKIEELAKLKLGVTLSISLHAPNDDIRNKTMPINNKWNIDVLLKACKKYVIITSRRISFEYALISGVNDSKECADELASRLHGMLCHVNLIPVNEIKEVSYIKSTRKRAMEFCDMLNKNGINTTIRRTLGEDINAACGQLRRDNVKREEE